MLVPKSSKRSLHLPSALGFSTNTTTTHSLAILGCIRPSSLIQGIICGPTSSEMSRITFGAAMCVCAQKCHATGRLDYYSHCLCQTAHGDQSPSTLLLTCHPVQGLDSILVVVDQLTKLAHFIACSKTATAKQTTDLFLNHVACHHRLPDSIVSDHGPQFSSHFWRRLWSLLRASTNLSSGHDPQSNSQTNV